MVYIFQLYKFSNINVIQAHANRNGGIQNVDVSGIDEANTTMATENVPDRRLCTACLGENLNMTHNTCDRCRVSKFYSWMNESYS